MNFVYAKVKKTHSGKSVLVTKDGEVLDVKNKFDIILDDEVVTDCELSTLYVDGSGISTIKARIPNHWRSLHCVSWIKVLTTSLLFGQDHIIVVNHTI